MCVAESPAAVYLVRATIYGDTRTLGGFTDAVAAQVYRDELEAQATEPLDETFAVVELELDTPRSDRFGAWDVEVAPGSGQIVRAEFSTWSLPSQPPQTQISHRPTARVHSYRAWGATREEATERARAYLLQEEANGNASARWPFLSSTSSP